MPAQHQNLNNQKIVQTSLIGKNLNVPICDGEQILCECDAQDLLPFGECLCEMGRKANKVDEKIKALKAGIETLDYKIKHLTPYFSQAQIRCWKHNRRELKNKLKFFKGIQSLQKKEVSVKALINSQHRLNVAK